MKKISIKKLLIVIIIALTFILHTTVFAVGGQANGTSDSLYDKTVNYFFELIRSMESQTGTLGKKAEINTTNYVDTSENGIDCHLEKNTEYGTITILAASAYGNKTSNDTVSTGANNSGVFQMSNGKYEFVANTLEVSGTRYSNSYNMALYNADARYVDKYTSTTPYSIPGDGIIETDGWGGSTGFVTTGIPVFDRGHGGLFGYYGNNYGGANSVRGARAVVVCGPGL